MKDTTAQKWIDVLIKLEKKVDELEKKIANTDAVSRRAVLDLVYPWCADDDGSVGKIGDMREVLDDIEALPSVFEGENLGGLR